MLKFDKLDFYFFNERKQPNLFFRLDSKRNAWKTSHVNNGG